MPRIDVQLSASCRTCRAGSARPITPRPTPLSRRCSDAAVGRRRERRLQLLPPQQFYGDRINQLDIRVGKILRFGARRTQISLDLFNALNNSSMLNANATYNRRHAWEIPTHIPGGRLMKITGQFEF